MQRFNYLTLFVIIVIISSFAVSGQTSVEKQKAEEIAAEFNKSKTKIKEKRGFVSEITNYVKNTVLVKKDISKYAGSYQALNNTETLVSLRVGSDGEISGGGYDAIEKGQLRYFKFKDATIKDGLLTATKLYDDNTTEIFEAAFLKQVSGNNFLGDMVTISGLGVKYNTPRIHPKTGQSASKLFFAKN
jgi:hypothetical protein